MNLAHRPLAFGKTSTKSAWMASFQASAATSPNPPAARTAICSKMANRNDFDFPPLLITFTTTPYNLQPINKRFYPRQHLPFQKLQHRPAAGGNEIHILLHFGQLKRLNGFPAANHTKSRALGSSGDESPKGNGSVRITLLLELSQRPVPDNGLGAAQDLRVAADGFRTDVVDGLTDSHLVDPANGRRPTHRLHNQVHRQLDLLVSDKTCRDAYFFRINIG